MKTEGKQKKRIAIVSLGYGWLPCEPGPSRFYDIAKIFCENDYVVDFITSDFQHFEKKKRDQELIKRQNYPFRITLISTPEYKSNIGIKRIFSNHVAAWNVSKYLRTKRYDVVYCSIPANDVAFAVAQYCHKFGIPFIVDIEDLWPEAMGMVIKRKWLQRLIFPYFMKDAERVYRYADAVIGTSSEYTKRATKYQYLSIPQKTIYVGVDLNAFDKGIKEYFDRIQKEQEEFWISYAGSIGKSYDIVTLLYAAQQLQKMGKHHIKIKILGTGVLKDKMEELSARLQCENVEFLGYISYPEMAAYLAKSDILLNSFVKGASQSIVNKVGDYLAAGRPIINTLENREFQKIVDIEQVGINIVPENVQELVKAICDYDRDREKCEKQSINARKTAEKFFDRKHTYPELLVLAEKLIKEKDS